MNYKRHLLLTLFLMLNVVYATSVEAKTITHLWYSEDSIVQEYVRYAFSISNNDLDFVAMLDAENWRWDPHRQASVPDNRPWMSQNGREDSRWFCQLHRRRHRYIVDDERFWNDWKRQLDQCYNKYKWWTRFYWYDVRHLRKKLFQINETIEKSLEYNYPPKAPTQQTHQAWCRYVW